MLPPFIIEQIKKREEGERARHEQPHLEIEMPRAPRPKQESGGEVDKRGITIIEL
ncbi:MAG: hypothetical protein KBF88_09785 [Polyangiaceae bacterium]|nr:hypothetical protein [Polyangiaceae bacterium]